MRLTNLATPKVGRGLESGFSSCDINVSRKASESIHFASLDFQIHLARS